MMLQMISAALLALLVCLGIGKGLIPWLKKKGFVQPLKDEVENGVYSQDKTVSSGDE